MGSASAYKSPDTTAPSSPSLNATRPHERDPDEQTALLSDLRVLPEYGASPAPTGSSEDQRPAGQLRRSISEIRRTHKRERKRARYDYLAYYVPVFRWLPTYNWQLFAGDLVAGATMSCLLVPQSMSYASGLAKLDPVHGLFGASIQPMVYAMLGTCAQLSVGPEAALSLLIGQTISQVTSKTADAETSTHIAVAVTGLITFQVGAITFLLGLFRGGFLDAVLSRPLLRGFVTAVGVVILVEQLIPILGLQALEKASGVDRGSIPQKMIFILRNVMHTHLLTFGVATVTLAILVAYRLAKPGLIKKYDRLKYVPEVLLAVVGTTILTAALRWDRAGLAILGKVSAGHVKIRYPMHHATAYFTDTLSASFLISIMGYIDSIVAAKQNASLHNYSMSPNRELVALGAANIVGSLVSGTLVAYGSITRSRLNSSAGARTPMASLISAGLVLLCTFFLLRFLYFLPKAVLSSIICLVVFSILQETPHDVIFFAKLRAWKDLSLMAITFCLTVFWSVQMGVLVSVTLSLLMVVQASSTMHVKIMGRVKGTDEWVTMDHEEDEDNEEVPGVLIARIRETNMTFANAGALKERLRRLERYGAAALHPSTTPKRGDAEILVLHMADVESIDFSALQVLYEVIETYKDRGVNVYIVHAGPEARALLTRAGIVELISRRNLQPTVKAALDTHYL